MEKREVGEGLITSHNNCDSEEFVFISWFIDSRLGTNDNLLRGYQMPYTNNNGHWPSPTVTFRWRHYSSFLFHPNVDLHTGQQQQFLHPSLLPPLLRSHIILVPWPGFQFQPFIWQPSFFLTWYGPFPLSLVVWLWTGTVGLFGDAGNICSSSEDESLSYSEC